MLGNPGHTGYRHLTVPAPQSCCLSAGAYLALLGTSFCLQGAGAALHTLGEAEVAVVGAVVQVSQPRQGQDVVTGDPQDGQFGQLLPIGVAWHLRTAGEASGAAAKVSAERAPLSTPVGWQGVEAACLLRVWV